MNLLIVTLIAIRILLIVYFNKYNDIDKANHDTYLKAALRPNKIIDKFIIDLVLDYPTLVHRVSNKVGIVPIQILSEIVLSFTIYLYLKDVTEYGEYIFLLYLVSFPFFADFLQFNARVIGLMCIVLMVPIITMHDSYFLNITASILLLFFTNHISKFSFQSSLIFISLYFILEGSFDKTFLIFSIFYGITILNPSSARLFAAWYKHIFWSFKNQFEIYIRKGYFRKFGEKTESLNFRFWCRRILGRLRAMVDNNITLIYLLFLGPIFNATFIFLIIFIILSISPRLDRSIGEADRYLKYIFIFGISNLEQTHSESMISYGFSYLESNVFLPVFFSSALLWSIYRVWEFRNDISFRSNVRKTLSYNLKNITKPISKGSKILTLPLSNGNLLPSYRTSYPYSVEAAKFLSEIKLYPFLDITKDNMRYFEFVIISKEINTDWVNHFIENNDLCTINENEEFILCKN